MGRSQREKGYRGEAAFAHAIGGKRVPLSGAVEGYEGDVTGMGLSWQVKVRGDGFKSLYEWLKGHDALGLRADRRGWLVVMPVETLWKLLDRDAPQGYEKAEDEAPLFLSFSGRASPGGAVKDA